MSVRNLENTLIQHNVVIHYLKLDENRFLLALSLIIFVWGNATTQSITAAAIPGTSTILGQINVAQLMDFKGAQ